MRNKKTPIIRRTKIVATIGPASGSIDVLADLISAGMNVARMNLSHGTFDDHIQYINNVRSESDRLGIPIAILIDIPGPKYRSGPLNSPSVRLEKGASITLTTRKLVGDGSLVSVNLPTFPLDVKPGDVILLDDGAMQLKCDDVQSTDVTCTVLAGGVLTPGRGIAVPGRASSMPFMTDQLRNYIDFAIEQKPDFIALSFVSKPEDMIMVRELITRRGTDIPLIAKIERGAAVETFDAILAVSDAVMVARGDLGVDIPLERLPLVQKEIIHKSNRAGKPVITATQMLESMINSPRPTRAEVSDVSNAIFDGTDAVMLSAETSIGKYPVQAVSMMSAVAVETEKVLPYDQWIAERDTWLSNQTEELISYNACLTARRLGSAAIVAFTSSGSTAGRVSKYRPSTPILAISPNIDTCRRLILNWGVQANQIATPKTVDTLFLAAVKVCKKIKLAKKGDNIVVTGGIPLGKAGTTNLLKVQEVE